jgi:hypothetical protein
MSSHGGVQDLEFDGVVGVLPRPYSFSDNRFSFGMLLWRSVKLQIRDGAASAKEVTCPLSLGWPLRWCRGRLTSFFLGVFLQNP